MTQQRSEAPRLRANLARSGKGLGLAPTSKIFAVLPEGKTRKIRKCIDTCIACRLAESLKLRAGRSTPLTGCGMIRRKRNLHGSGNENMIKYFPLQKRF